MLSENVVTTSVRTTCIIELCGKPEFMEGVLQQL